MSAPKSITSAELETISRAVDRAWFKALFGLYLSRQLRKDWLGITRKVFQPRITHGRGLKGRALAADIEWKHWCLSGYKEAFYPCGCFLTLGEFLENGRVEDVVYGMVYPFVETSLWHDPIDLKATEAERRLLFRLRVGRIHPDQAVVWDMARRSTDPEFLHHLAKIKRALQTEKTFLPSIVFGNEVLSRLQRLLLTRWDFSPDEVPPLMRLLPRERTALCRRLLNLPSLTDFQVDQTRKRLELPSLLAGKLKLRIAGNTIKAEPFKRSLHHRSRRSTIPRI